MTRRVLYTGALLLIFVCLCTSLSVRAEGVYEKDPMTDEEHQRVVATTIDHHSFSPPLLRYYFGLDNDEDVPHWLSSGSTVISDKYVRLTPHETSQTGHFWNTQPLDMHAFEIVVGFHVFRESPGKGADGFAMWLVDSIPHSNGPLFGHPPSFKGIGILFDVYDNDNGRDNPMISVIYESGLTPPRRYSPQRDFRGETLGNCVFDFVNQNPPAKLATARVRYNDGTLQVYVSKAHGKDEVLCFQVNQKVHLDVEKTNYFLGFTAATGGVAEIHDIVYTHLSPLESATYAHDVRQSIAPGAVAGADGSIVMNDEDENDQDGGEDEESEEARIARLEKELEAFKKRQEAASTTTRAPARRTRETKKARRVVRTTTTTTEEPVAEDDDEDEYADEDGDAFDDDDEVEFEEEEEELDEEELPTTTTTTKAPRRRPARVVKRQRK